MNYVANFYSRPDATGDADALDSRLELLRMFEAAATPNTERHARFAQLAPRDAVRTWMLFDFHPLDEPALCFAIRQDPDIDLDDDRIADEIFGFVDSVSTDEEPLEPDDPDLEDLVTDQISFLRRATVEAVRYSRRRR